MTSAFLPQVVGLPKTGTRTPESFADLRPRHRNRILLTDRMAYNQPDASISCAFPMQYDACIHASARLTTRTRAPTRCVLGSYRLIAGCISCLGLGALPNEFRLGVQRSARSPSPGCPARTRCPASTLLPRECGPSSV